MASSNACWGIECGSGAIKAIRLELDGDAVVVTDFVVLGHQKVLSTPGVDHHDAMRVALGTLVSQYDLTNAQVAVGVPGHAAFARFAKLPPVEPKKVPDIVKFEAQQQIPFSLEEVEWDYQTFQSPDSPDVEVGIFAMTKERLKHQLDLLSDVGISPDVITLNPLAAYNALAYDLEFTEQTPGTIILDIGTTSTDLVIAEAGRVWVRTFPIGGHHFTEAIVETFKLSYPKADRLKREAQQTKHSKHVFQAMRPVFTDLVQEVQRSIGYYQSLHKDARLTRLIGLGATFSLPGLRKFLKQQVGMDVYRLEQFKRATARDESRRSALDEAAGVLAPAYGLALQGIGFETIDANLVPTARVRESMWGRKTPYFVAAAGLAVVASGSMFYRPFTDSAAVKGTRAPSVIMEASRRVSELKGEAQTAGVIGGRTPDYTAANMIMMLDKPEYHAHLARDLGELLADADARLALMPLEEGESPVAGPAFELVHFQTSFVPRERSMSRYRGGQDARRPGRQRDADRGGMYGEFGEDPTPAEANLDKRRIAVRLAVTTPHPDPRRFVIESVQEWLRANAEREGVPYRIVAEPSDLIVSLDQATAATPGVAPGVRDPRDPRGGFDDFDPDDIPLAPGTIITGQPTQPGGLGTQPGDRELASLAPLEDPDREARRRSSRVELFWYVVLDATGDADAGGDS